MPNCEWFYREGLSLQPVITTLEAPFLMAALMVRSLTPWQTQTIMTIPLLVKR